MDNYQGQFLNIPNNIALSGSVGLVYLPPFAMKIQPFMWNTYNRPMDRENGYASLILFKTPYVT